MQATNERSINTLPAKHVKTHVARENDFTDAAKHTAHFYFAVYKKEATQYLGLTVAIKLSQVLTPTPTPSQCQCPLSRPSPGLVRAKGDRLTPIGPLAETRDDSSAFLQVKMFISTMP